MNNVDTSPLRAAREWRGISLALAARTSGLPLTQAEALEEGLFDEFESFDEVVAAAVLYGSSLGVGRDEAMALLDRAMQNAGNDASSDLGPEFGAAAFSAAVRERTQAQMRDGNLMNTPASTGFRNFPEYATASHDDTQLFDPPEFDLPSHETPLAPTVAAAAAPMYNPYQHTVPVPGNAPGHDDEEAPGELESWAATRDGHGDHRHLRHADPSAAPGGALLVKVLGEDRASRVVDMFDRVGDTARDRTYDLRERMAHSRKATLTVALIAGLVMLAVLVGVVAAVTSDDPPAGPPSAETPVAKAPAANEPAAKEPTAKTPADAKKPAKSKVTPIVKRPDIQVSVLNAGRTKGQAAAVAGRVEGLGYSLGEVGNSPTTYATSVILYPPKFRREAERLSKDTGITTLDTLPASKTAKLSVVVV